MTTNDCIKGVQQLQLLAPLITELRSNTTAKVDREGVVKNVDKSI